MKEIPREYLAPCAHPGKVDRLDYGGKFALAYTPAKPAGRVLYLIHGGGGDQYAFFCPAFLNTVDHMIEDGVLAPLCMVSPCFYDPAAEDKTPAASGVAVRKFISELPEVTGLELLPYHRLGTDTYRKLGREYLLKDVEVPSPEHMEWCRSVVRRHYTNIVE